MQLFARFHKILIFPQFTCQLFIKNFTVNMTPPIPQKYGKNSYPRAFEIGLFSRSQLSIKIDFLFIMASCLHQSITTTKHNKISHNKKN